MVVIPFTRAAYHALAFTHLFGHMPIGLHQQTWRVVYRACDLTKDRRRYILKPEHLELVERHPMVLTARRLLADGWKIDDRKSKCKVSSGLPLIKSGLDRLETTTVYISGKQGSF